MKFQVPVTVKLDPLQISKLRAAINKHYLGDEDANKMEGNEFVAKYPEMEIQEFKDAHYSVGATKEIILELEFDPATGDIKER